MDAVSASVEQIGILCYFQENFWYVATTLTNSRNVLAFQKVSNQYLDFSNKLSFFSFAITSSSSSSTRSKDNFFS